MSLSGVIGPKGSVELMGPMANRANGANRAMRPTRTNGADGPTGRDGANGAKWCLGLKKTNAALQAKVAK